MYHQQKANCFIKTKSNKSLGKVKEFQSHYYIK